MDMKLDSSGDLDLSTGDIELISGVTEAGQRVQIKLRFFKGEWFLAPTFGVPWFQDVLTKAPNTDVVRNLLIQSIESEPGIDKVTEFVLEYDSEDRSLTISNFRAQANGDFVDFEGFQLIEL